MGRRAFYAAPQRIAGTIAACSNHGRAVGGAFPAKHQSPLLWRLSTTVDRAFRKGGGGLTGQPSSLPWPCVIRHLRWRLGKLLIASIVLAFVPLQASLNRTRPGCATKEDAVGLQGIDPRIIEALEGASSSQLHQLKALIEGMLADPRRGIAARANLHLGQPVHFVDYATLRCAAARSFIFAPTT